MAEDILTLNHLNVWYGKPGKGVHAVKDVSFGIKKGEVFGIVGESGSGKTTIARAIMHIYPTESGDIIYRGEKINRLLPRRERLRLAGEIQMIFQDSSSSLNPRSKIYDILAEGLLSIRKDMSQESRDEAIHQIIRQVGIDPSDLDRFPHEFSGGQRQRIGIARAIVLKPAFLIADEPVSSLDMSLKSQILQLMLQLQKQYGLTYLIISHDISMMRAVCYRIAVICQGRIVEIASAEEIFTNPLHPYTRLLIASTPIPNPALRREGHIVQPSVSIVGDTMCEVTPGHFVLR